MAYSYDDDFIKSLIFDYLSKTNVSLARSFQKITNAVALPEGSATIADVVSYYRKTCHKKSNIKPNDRKKFSSDSNSESEVVTRAVETKKSLSKPLLNDNANVSKEEKDDTSSDGEFSDDETAVAAKSLSVPFEEVTSAKEGISTMKNDASRDNFESEEVTAGKTLHVPTNGVAKNLISPGSTKNVTQDFSANSSDSDELSVEKDISTEKLVKTLTPTANLERISVKPAIKKRGRSESDGTKVEISKKTTCDQQMPAKVTSADKNAVEVIESSCNDNESTHCEKVGKTLVDQFSPTSNKTTGSNNVGVSASRKGGKLGLGKTNFSDEDSLDEETETQVTAKPHHNEVTIKPSPQTADVPSGFRAEEETNNSAYEKSFPNSKVMQGKISVPARIHKLYKADESSDSSSEDETNELVNKQSLLHTKVTPREQSITPLHLKTDEADGCNSNSDAEANKLVTKSHYTAKVISGNNSAPEPAQQNEKAEESDGSCEEEINKPTDKISLPYEEVIPAMKSVSSSNREGIATDESSDSSSKNVTIESPHKKSRIKREVTLSKKSVSSPSQKSNEADISSDFSSKEENDKLFYQKSLSPAKVTSEQKSDEANDSSAFSSDVEMNESVVEYSSSAAKIKPAKKLSSVPLHQIQKADENDESSEEETNMPANEKSPSYEEVVPPLTQRRVESDDGSDFSSNEETTKPVNYNSFLSPKVTSSKESIPSLTRESERADDSDSSFDEKSIKPVSRNSNSSAEVTPAENSLHTPIKQIQKIEKSDESTEDEASKSANEKSPYVKVISTKKLVASFMPKSIKADDNRSDSSSDDDTIKPNGKKILSSAKLIIATKPKTRPIQKYDETDSSNSSSDEETYKPVNKNSLPSQKITLGKNSSPVCTQQIKKAKVNDDSSEQTSKSADKKTLPRVKVKPVKKSVLSTQKSIQADDSSSFSSEEETDKPLSKCLLASAPKQKTEKAGELPSTKVISAKKSLPASTKRIEKVVESVENSKEEISKPADKMSPSFEKVRPEKKLVPTSIQKRKKADKSDESLTHDASRLANVKSLSSEKATPTKNLSTLTEKSKQSEENQGSSEEKIGEPAYKKSKAPTKKLLSVSTNLTEKTNECDESLKKVNSEPSDKKSLSSNKITPKKKLKPAPANKSKKSEKRDDSSNEPANKFLSDVSIPAPIQNRVEGSVCTSSKEEADEPACAKVVPTLKSVLICIPKIKMTGENVESSEDKSTLADEKSSKKSLFVPTLEQADEHSNFTFEEKTSESGKENSFSSAKVKPDEKSICGTTRSDEKAEDDDGFGKEPSKRMAKKSFVNAKVSPAKKLMSAPTDESYDSDDCPVESSSKLAMPESTPVESTIKTHSSKRKKKSSRKTLNIKIDESFVKRESYEMPENNSDAVAKTSASFSLNKSKTLEPNIRENNDEDFSDEETEPPPAKKPAFRSSEKVTLVANVDNNPYTTVEDNNDSNATEFPKQTSDISRKQVSKKPEAKSDSKENETILKSNPRKRKFENGNNSLPRQNQCEKFAKVGNSNDFKNDVRNVKQQHRKFEFKNKFSGKNAGRETDRNSFGSRNDERGGGDFRKNSSKNNGDEGNSWNRKIHFKNNANTEFGNWESGKFRNQCGRDGGRYNEGGDSNFKRRSGEAGSKSRNNRDGFNKGAGPRNPNSGDDSSNDVKFNKTLDLAMATPHRRRKIKFTV